VSSEDAWCTKGPGLTAEAFKVFHEIDLDPEDLGTDRVAASSIVVKHLNDLCVHNAVGTAMLVADLVKLQKARMEHH
jgi:hypothetical protein